MLDTAKVQASNPAISIVIPVFNEAVLIERVCRSLADILSPLDEIIVVDDNSKDGTIRIVEQAKGDILLFLHADTTLPVEFANQLRDAFWPSKNRWGRFDVRLSGDHAALRLIEFMMNHRARLTGICTGDQCIFVKRDDFKRVPYPVIALMEDIEISKRLNGFSKPFVIRLPVVTSSRKWESEGILKTLLLMWRIRLLYFFGESPERLAARYYKKKH